MKVSFHQIGGKLWINYEQRSSAAEPKKNYIEHIQENHNFKSPNYLIIRIFA